MGKYLLLKDNLSEWRGRSVAVRAGISKASLAMETDICLETLKDGSTDPRVSNSKWTPRDLSQQHYGVLLWLW